MLGNIFTRKQIVVVAFILLLPTLIWLITRRTLLTVSTSTKNSSEVTLFYTVAGENPSRIRPGINLVKPGMATINASTEEEQTIVFQKAKTLWSNQVSINLQPQKENKKVIGNSRSVITCVSGDIYKPELLMSSCQNNYSYKQTLNGSISHEKSYPHQKIIGVTTSYKDGYLSIVSDYSEGSVKYKLVYTTSTNQITIDQGAGVSVGDVGDPRIFTSDNMRSFIILNPNNNTISFYQDTKDNTPLTNKLDPEFTKLNFEQFAVSLNSDNLSIAYPLSRESSASDGLGDPNTQVQVNKYSVTDSAITRKSKRIIQLNKINGDIFLQNETLLLLGQDGFLHIFDITNDQHKLQASIPNVSNVTTTSDDIYYRSQKSIYSYIKSENKSYLLSRLSDINGSNLMILKGRPVVIGNTNASPSTFGAYVITDKEKPNTLNLATIIPYNPKELPIINSDYLDRSMYFSVDLKSMIIDRDTGTVTYNKAEFEQKKKIIIGRLKADGVDVKKYDINFKPGP